MKKRLLLVLLTGLLAVPQVFAASYDFSAVCESGQTLYYKIKGDNVSVVEGEIEPEGDIIIPSTVTYQNKIYNVTTIGSFAFDNCKDLTSVDIPNSVTEIGIYAFYNCKGLTSVDIPNSVTEIGAEAFDNCTGLTSVDIPNSVTEIGSYAFSGCTGLTKPIYNDKLFVKLPESYSGSYTIPDGITEICHSAFYGCTGLTSVDIPNSVTTIGERTFYNCKGLTSVDIPNSVTTIGDRAFYNCKGLTKPIYNDKLFVKLPESYSGSYTIPDGITEICNRAFYNCTGLTSVDIPNSVTEIGDGAFSGCKGLTSVDIPNSVTEIGADAFYGCSNLSEAYLSIFTRYSSTSFPSTTKLISNDLSAYVNTCSATFKIQTSGRTEQFKEYGLIFDGKLYKSNADNIVTIQNLQSNKSYVVIAYHIDNNDTTMIHSLPFEFTTKSLSPSATAIETKPTSLVLNGSYYKGDAELIGEEFIFNETIYKSNNAIITGLVPDTEYSVTYRVNTTTGSEETTQTFRTAKDLTLKTLNPKVSEGKVVVCAETNISDYETNVGFEWRKYDAPASLPSKSGKAFLYNGSMKGTIKNLATDSYWNVRAYYTANDGTSYYGDWVTFDPGDFSWFEPEVHTYPATIVPNQPPQLRGYAVEGSDDVEEQGFEYWPKAPSTKSTEPEGIKRIPATGTVMQATITDYEYSTEYICRSYVKTSTKTFYGEEQTFTTPDDPRPLYTFIVQAGENGRVNEEVNGQYREGESVEITATPNQGYKFTQWSDLMTDNPRTVTVTQDTTIVASFEKADVSTTDILADPDKSDVQVSDVLGRIFKIYDWNNLKGELRRGVYILFKGDDSQKILVE